MEAPRIWIIRLPPRPRSKASRPETELSVRLQKEVDDLFHSATTKLSLNDLVGADLKARQLLEQEPRHAGAHCVIGIIAERLGLCDFAEAGFLVALAADPSSRSALDGLARVETARMQARPVVAAGERHLLIKSWGAGFWSDVSHVLGAAFLAELTGRIPVTHWGHNSCFRTPGSDAFRRYFKPISYRTIEDLRRLSGADFFPDKWTSNNLDFEDYAKWEGIGSRLQGIYFLHRSERVAVSDFYIHLKYLIPWIPPSHPSYGQPTDAVLRRLANQYLIPQDDIRAVVQDFHRRHLRGIPSIAVHVRGSDKVTECEDLDELNRQYFPVLDREDPASKIFLLTDDGRWLRAFRDRYGDRVVATDCQRAETDQGVHIVGAADRSRLGTEVMVDTYLALTCEKFIGNGRSNVSAMISVLKDWGPGQCTLLAPSVLTDP